MTTSTTSSASTRLSGRLGVGSILFMVVAAAAPLTVIAGVVPAGIVLGNGASYPASYLVTTAVLLLFAVGFTTMSRHVPDAGAFYAYVAKGLGRRPGVGAALLALVSYATVLLAVWAFLGFAVGDAVSTFGGPSVPWWIWAFACQVAVGLLGYRNIDLSGRVLGVLLVSEVLIVLLVDSFVVGEGGTGEGLSTAMFHASGFFDGAPGLAVTFAIAGYIGFEATAVFRDEARDPERTIPRATYASLVVIGAFYAFGSWALVSAFGDSAVVDELGSGAGIADVALSYVGSGARDIVTVLLVTSLFAAALCFHNILARYIHALSNTDVLPTGWGASHEHHLSPHVGSLVQSAVSAALLVACLIAGLDPVAQIFTWFAGVAAVGVIVLMLMTCLAVIAFFRKRPALTDSWHGLVAPGLGAVGLLAFLAMTVQNLAVLVGGSATLAWIIGAGLVSTFTGGYVMAHLRPHIARTIVEELA